ncbi:MAG: nickel pincer cofactor biosynthesis protein LarB [Deltaproteobacteria bacterium]
MNVNVLTELLDGVKNGTVSTESALSRLKALPFEDMGQAVIDSHRELRQGFPEVILGEGKSTAQIISIIEKLRSNGSSILATRIDAAKAVAIIKAVPSVQYNSDARTLTFMEGEFKEKGKGIIMVISAGTSDIPVAEEAAITAFMMGNRVDRLYDVGVAGIHRLFFHRERITSAGVLIVCAGMEGALPSVVGGIVARPVIAVPTSVGYGASFGGISALLGMLNSCAPAVTVVNIDNGFGAGYAASLINRKD